MSLENIPIIDLHCDLLASIDENPLYNFDHPGTRCSIPQLLKGKVKLQILALFAITRPGSTKVLEKQLELFKRLPKQESLLCRLSIENASLLAEEKEPLEHAFKRLDDIPSPLYISLTWNDENRFGGGNFTNIGLKEDGKVLLDYLDKKKIALDFSHTSDYLAYDLFNYIDKKGLKIPVIASHSNFRAVTYMQRNLTDEIAKEIINRKGLIGLNFVRKFIGKQEEDLFSHIEQALFLEGASNLALGADFFGDIELPTTPYDNEDWYPLFFPTLDNSSCYPFLIEQIASRFPESLIRKIAYENVEDFLLREHASSIQ